MKNLKKVFAAMALALTVVLTGCSKISQSYADKINEAAAEALKTGDQEKALTYDEVVKALGDEHTGVYDAILTKSGALVWTKGNKIITVTFVAGYATAAVYAEGEDK